MKPKLYYRVNDNGVPFDSFCSDAAIGANQAGIECVPFSDIKSVDRNPYNIVVTSVEESLEWLDYNVESIDDSWAGKRFKKREETVTTIDKIQTYPCFIKPHKQIKAFTGVMVDSEQEAKLFTQDFKNLVSVQEIVNIESEYRVYYTEHRGILGIKHYLGDPYLKPDKEFVYELLSAAKENLKQKSYTLDIGITTEGETLLIEINDGWSVGNYGLSPSLYYSFIKARWLQLTGILK